MKNIKKTDETESPQFACSEKDGVVNISNGQGMDEKAMGEALQKATGSKEIVITKLLLSQNANTFNVTGLDREESINTSVAILKDLAPQDTTQGILATQMIATHNLAMEMLRRAGLNNQTFAGVDANINRATKLLRTFTAQTEVMQKLQGKSGKQKMTVEHVHVNEGGQAIIGTVENGGRGNSENGQ